MARVYTAEQRQHFAQYIDDRARLRPLDCSGGLDCWVEFGPPAISKNPGHCLGCGGAPYVRPETRQMVRGKYAR